MKKGLIFLLFIAFSVVTLNVSAQDKEVKVSEEYKKELAIYYKISGSDASMKIAVDASLKMVKAQMPQFKVDDATLKEITDKLIVEMMDAMAPIYAKHISLEDLKAMNKFYSSPAGKRIGAATPALTKESMEFSMTVASKLQKIIMKMVAGF